MVNFLRKNVFWVIQVLAWGTLSLWPNIQITDHDHTLTTVLIVNSVFFSGFVSTSIHRWFLKRFVKKANFTKKKVVIVFGFVFVSSLICVLISLGLVIIYGYLFPHLELQDSDLSEKLLEFLDIILLFIISFILITGWTFFYYGIRYLIRVNNARIQRLLLRDQVKNAQLNTLKGHINARFMVSTLQKIKELMLTDISKARQMLTELSELLRYSLTKNSVDLIGLEHEMEMAQKYIDLNAIGDSNSLLIKPGFDILVEKIEIPPMLFLNFVELTTMALNLNKIDDRKDVLEIEIVDDQIKFEVTAKVNNKVSCESKVLLKNIKERLGLLFGDDGICDMVLKSEVSSLLMIFPVQTANKPTAIS